MAWYWVYLLGIVTPFATAALVAAVAWSVSKTHIVDGGACDFCKELGWRAPDTGSAWVDYKLPRELWLTWHQWFRARRLPHRILWQREEDKWYRRADSPHREKLRRRYGVVS